MEDLVTPGPEQPGSQPRPPDTPIGRNGRVKAQPSPAAATAATATTAAAAAAAPPNAWDKPLPRRGPPDGAIQRVTLPRSAYVADYHERTIRVTLTGTGWPAVTNEEIFTALQDKGVDMATLRTAWKGSNMRFLNLTFETAEATAQATTLGQVKIREATATITGREKLAHVKVHWVPAWMRDDFVRTCLEDYGEVTSFHSETTTVGGRRIFTGTKIATLKTSAAKLAALPVAFEVDGPVPARLLVSVRGRPPLCLSCFASGHKQRQCPARFPAAAAADDTNDTAADTHTHTHTHTHIQNTRTHTHRQTYSHAHTTIHTLRLSFS